MVKAFGDRITWDSPNPAMEQIQSEARAQMVKKCKAPYLVGGDWSHGIL